MRFSNIVETINSRLAGEMLSINEVRPLLDSAIDDINTRLNTCFPVFSELPAESTEYTAIPDKYIRTVVIPGAVFKFYIVDEEGAEAAPKAEEDFRTNLFYMERDYLMLVPEEYWADSQQGVLHLNETHPLSDGGLKIRWEIY